MRDPFNTPVDLIDTDRRAGNELARTARDYALQNGDAKPFADTLARHQIQGASLHGDLIAEDPNTRLMDPETKELYFRSRTQEEEILLLRKQVADASSKELQLLSEKHILERKLADLRMAVDEREEDAISGALKQLNEKRNQLEENMRLSNDLKVWCYRTFQECSRRRIILVHFFIAWYVSRVQCSPISNICFNHYNCYKAFIPTNAMEDQIVKFWGIQLNLETYIIPIINKQLRRETNLPHLTIWSRIGTLSPSMLRIQTNKCSMHPLLIISAAPSNYFQENTGPREARLDDDSQFYMNDNPEYSADGDPLPGIEGFQIVGEPRPGITLTACGFPTNGTTLCNFQWVRCLEDGTSHSIEGATMYDYVVTADDVGTRLAVDCTPMDDNGRQGDLVRKFANGENKISCDPDMQNDINTCILRGRADFDVYVLGYSPDEWEHATLVLKRTGYQINISQKDEVVIDEKYSANLQAKIPNGRTTQFVLVSSGGLNLPFNTQGITEPNNEDNDVRLRDLIVLVMRIFQNKALDAKRKGKA